MKAYIEETDTKLSNCSPELYDACLLASIQGINLYKVSAYRTAAAWSKTLNLLEGALLFHDAELDEIITDERLSFLAMKEINRKANSPFTLSM